MPRAHPITGIRSLTSKTWFNQPPVEWGRAGGSVATIAVGTATGDNGTGSGTNGKQRPYVGITAIGSV